MQQLQEPSKRKRANGGEEEEPSVKKPKIETEPIPVELIQMMCMDYLSRTEREEAGWALLLVFRMVSRELRNRFEDMWRAAIENFPQGASFPQVVARFGWLPLLQWAVQQGWSRSNNKQVLGAAVRGGHINVMERIQPIKIVLRVELRAIIEAPSRK